MNKEVPINITTEEGDLLIKALMELPYKFSAQLIMKIDTQVREQLSAKTE
jgi:hypothetical protein